MEVIVVDDLAEFSEERRVRLDVFKQSDKLGATLLFYNPGQSTPIHLHSASDEVFYVIKGRATITQPQGEVEVPSGSLIFVPAREKHGIENRGPGPLIMMFVKAPKLP